jgi:hypothetical protein
LKEELSDNIAKSQTIKSGKSAVYGTADCVECSHRNGKRTEKGTKHRKGGPAI